MVVTSRRANAAMRGWARCPHCRAEHAKRVRLDPPMTRQDLEQRVTRVAEVVLAEQQFVSAIDVLVGLGWLAPSHVDTWRQGRIETLEQVVQANLVKSSAAMTALRQWAQNRGLNPSETDPALRAEVGDECVAFLAVISHEMSP
jgi:hypothetical protein